jgi:GNAT superfamily N-acetyltransferase
VVHSGAVRIRYAGAADVAALEPLWAEFCAAAGAAVTGGSSIAARVRDRLEAESGRDGSRPTYRLAIAEHEGVPVGFASYSVVDRGFLSDCCAVLVDVVHVASGRRKSGIGSALLRDAVVFADEVGAGDIVVNVPSASRDMNRFYARLGFGPLVVRRSAPIGALRRRLGLEVRADVRDTADLSDVQRTLRRRAILGRGAR